MSILNSNFIDLEVLRQALRSLGEPGLRNKLYLFTLFVCLCGSLAAGGLLTALGRAGTSAPSLATLPGAPLDPGETLRESLIEHLATARAELQEFALQVESTRARLRRLRDAKAPTDLEVTRQLGCEAAWATIRQVEGLQKRQKKLSRDAEKVFSGWRKEIRGVTSPEERQALVTHYKQVRRELNSLLKQQDELIGAAGISAKALTNLAMELEHSTLSALNISRQTAGNVDSGLLHASRQVSKSIASVDQFRKSARTIASLNQPR